MVTRSRSESGWYTSLFEMNKLFIIHKNRGSVYLKQKLCLSPIEVLFKINTGSIETELASARTNFFRLKGLKALPLLRACQRWDIKNSLQPLSPSIRTFARETEKAECGERLIIYNRVKVVHLSFQCCTSSTRT